MNEGEREKDNKLPLSACCYTINILATTFLITHKISSNRNLHRKVDVANKY